MKENFFNTCFSRFILICLAFFCANLLLLSCNDKTNKNVAKSTQNVINSHNVPSRIVSLSPANTEILASIGATSQLIARTPLCDFPPEVTSIQSFGGFDGKTFNFESLLLLKPDFVYGTQGMHDYLFQFLNKYDIPLRLANIQTIDDIIEEIEILGEITGHSDSAKSAVKKINEELVSAKEIAKKSFFQGSDSLPVKYYFEVWNNPLITIGKNSFMSQLFSFCDLENCFGTLYEPYPQISLESVIKENPDIIFLPSDAPKQRVEELKARSGWNKINAVKNDMIFFVKADLITRSGPRVGEAILEIAKICKDYGDLQGMSKNK